jgi:elongation factor Ts
MASVSAADVKKLRTQTGAGMMDCKRALADAKGDLGRATDLLRERGLASAGKRAGRETSEGVVAIARSGSAGSIVELGCETDFVARTDEYQALSDEIAQLVLADPDLASVEQVLAAPLGDGKVADRLNAAISKLGENVELKRARRLSAPAGVTGGYVHAGGKLGVLVSIHSDGKGEALEALAKDIAMHVAAVDPTPLAVDRDSVDPALVEKERAILHAQATQSGKPENVIEKIVEGRLRKFFSENCLLEQAFVKDSDVRVEEVAKRVAAEIGADVKITEFVRFRLGEESAD